MIETEIFLGILVEGSLLEHLSLADQSLVSAFIGDRGEYLCEVESDGRKILGKFAGKVCDIHHLELLQANVYSLLGKLMPSMSFQQTPLALFPVYANRCS